MSAIAAPTVLPRPIRTQQAAAAAGASKLPEIPPRPSNKPPDRSISPGSNYPSSPFYEVPSGSSLSRTVSQDPSHLGLPARPPSVSLPSIGQEGAEYADLPYENVAQKRTRGPENAAQTRNISEDLHLHAPRPSLPKASAKAQVQAVTRTDSTTTPTHDDQEPVSRMLRSRTSFSRPHSQASGSRRASVAYGEEQGPAIGLRVPINPNLGDVQAPSPAQGFASGAGFAGSNGSNHQQKRPHHTRTKSGREIFLPPGSYGLHGHGVPAQDKFEKDWYAKHPEQFLHEEVYGHGHYTSTGDGRGESALSSDDLNRMVRGSAGRGAGLGTMPSIEGYPDEQIGYLATEQYSSRMASPQSANQLSKRLSNSSQPPAESPLRKASFPHDGDNREEFHKFKHSSSGNSENFIESENEEDTVHVDAPTRYYNKIVGGEEHMHETDGAGKGYIPHDEDEDRLRSEHDYSVPILASDEVAKEAGGDDLKPAVSPKHERRGSAYFGDEYRSGDITPSSRPSSRPGSIHGSFGGLSRFISRHDDREDMHTPLENVDEYEPLFPDGEDDEKKALSYAERFKQRPGFIKHRFPSQDIWEDTPESALHVASVSTPDLPDQANEPTIASTTKTFETPEQEGARKGEPDEAERQKLIPKEERLARSQFAPWLRDDMPTRPGMGPQFPSQDVWEDSPDSMHLVTTVASPPPPENNDPKSPTEALTSKPMVPPRPVKNKLLEGDSAPQIQPSIPARPSKRLHAVPPADAKLTEVTAPPNKADEKSISLMELRRVPSIPDRPKPQVPARPAKKQSFEALTKSNSAQSAGSSGSTETEKDVSVTSPPSMKAKPIVPARPVASSKLANLKGTFMSNLNQRLQLGPQGLPIKKEPEPEAGKKAAPLSDARKARARGPQRRAPAKSFSQADEAIAAPAQKPVNLSISPPRLVWQVDDKDGILHVFSNEPTNISSASGIISSDHKEDSYTEATAYTQSAAIAAKAMDSALSTKPAEEYAAPGLGRSGDILPTAEKRILSEQPHDDGLLSTTKTASSGAASGEPLSRTERNPTDPPCLSQKTTASSTLSGPPLENVPIYEHEHEPLEAEHKMLHDESAPMETVSTTRGAQAIDPDTPSLAERLGLPVAGLAPACAPEVTTPSTSENLAASDDFAPLPGAFPESEMEGDIDRSVEPKVVSKPRFGEVDDTKKESGGIAAFDDVEEQWKKEGSRNEKDERDDRGSNLVEATKGATDSHMVGDDVA